MCRFIAYLGKPVVLHDILIKPENSLIEQSRQARELEQPLNGDGFGLCWYAPIIDDEPGLFRSIQPAWNDLNLRHLTAKIQSNCFFAHLRAASKGGVSKANCHPFCSKQYSFMYNGDIGDFQTIKRDFCNLLSNEAYQSIHGQTDTEHFFALLMDLLSSQQTLTTTVVADAYRKAIQQVEALRQQHQLNSATFINGVFTDGNSMVASKYVADSDHPKTLYYAHGSEYVFMDGEYHMLSATNGVNEAIIIASEKLNDVNADWVEVPVNHFVLVNDKLEIEVAAI